MKYYDPKKLALLIDHTWLKPDAVEEDIRKLCHEAVQYGFAAVCASPVFVQLAKTELAGSDVKVCTVIGFPTGAHLTSIKFKETEKALADGAEEVDMVIQIGALKSGQNEVVSEEIALLAGLCHQKQAILKVIIETALLTEDEIIRVTELIQKAGGDFVKTSTGFGPGGATVDAVQLIQKSLSDSSVGIKASGGIRNLSSTLTMLKAGATRIGTSSGIQIIEALTINNRPSEERV